MKLGGNWFGTAVGCPPCASRGKRAGGGYISAVASIAGALFLMASTGMAETEKPKIYFSFDTELVVNAITDGVSATGYDLEKLEPRAAFEEFCSSKKPSIVVSVAEMSSHFEDICKTNEFGKVAKAELGFMTFVLVQKASDPPMTLTERQLYLALAELVPGDDDLELSAVSKWSDVDPALPDLPVKIILAPQGLESRGVFDGSAMVAGCRDISHIKRIFEADDRSAVCLKLRKDVVVEVSGSAAKLEALKNSGGGSITMLPDADYEKNKSWLRIIPFNGLLPTPESVVAEDYTLTVPVYVYAHTEQLSGDTLVPAVRSWFLEAISERAVHETGYLDQFGFTSLPTATREWQRKAYSE